MGGRLQLEATADEGESLLREFGLEQAIVRAREEICFRSCDRGDEVMHGDRLAVERALPVRIGCELHRLDGAFLPGNDGPEAAVVAPGREGKECIESAGIEVWDDNRAGMGGKAGESLAAAGGDVEEDLI